MTKCFDCYAENTECQQDGHDWSEITTSLPPITDYDDDIGEWDF